jgi:glutathione S-transferase
LLEELGLPYQCEYIDIFSGNSKSRKYRSIHPHGSVPAIDIDGKVMYESGAICHWLTDQFPQNKLAPLINDPLRQMYEQWMFYAPGTMEPPYMMAVMHEFLLPEKRRVPEIVPWALKQYQTVLTVLDKELSNRDYIVSNDFSTADIMIGTYIIWSDKYLEPFGALQAYTQRLVKRSAYIKATDDRHIAKINLQ